VQIQELKMMEILDSLTKESQVARQVTLQLKGPRQNVADREGVFAVKMWTSSMDWC
jgi:hypothetical protein